MTPIDVAPERTDDLALATVGSRGLESAEFNRRLCAARTSGINSWSKRLGRDLNQAEEEAVIVLADGLARQREIEDGD